jgi:CheY-like chemotaxis protein
MAAKSRKRRITKSSKRLPGKRASVGRTQTRKPATPDVVQAALAAFAHEVRTPLTGILAISDLLATSDLGERERRWADTIKAGAEHLASLATLFVDAARTARNGSSLRRDMFDLRALLRTVGDSLAGRAAAKGLHAKVTISLAVAPLRDSQTTPKGDRQVGITCAVSDSGIGLTMAEIKRLFRPFSQANVSIASRFGGAGLGLSSVKQLARTMGGDVAVSPRRGGGTVFTLTVFLQPAEDDDSELPGSRAVAAENVEALRVLGIEDNPFGRVVLNTILTELGHQAEFIGRGEDAEKRLVRGVFDAVLMDMVLPGIDGIEAIRRIRNMHPPLGDIPIIGISGRGEDEAASREAGADAFLVKPVSPRALATALLEATRREEAET